MLYSELCSAEVRLARGEFRRTLLRSAAPNSASQQPLTARLEKSPMCLSLFNTRDAARTIEIFKNVLKTVPPDLARQLKPETDEIFAFLRAATDNAPEPLPDD